MMRNIGYRVKPKSDFILEFFDFYKKSFDSMEIKLNNDMLHAPCMEHIIELATPFEFRHISFHAPKKAFYTETDFNLMCLFLNSSNVFDNNFLITHFYSDISYNQNYITTILKTAKFQKVSIAVENVEVGKDLLGYLIELKNFAINYGFKICLDVGHLLFSANKCNITNACLIDFFSKDIWWFENIVEFHIHDFNDVECHLNIGSGIANFNDVTRLLAIFKSDCPIILETTISDLSIQGIAEVKILKERINESADN